MPAAVTPPGVTEYLSAFEGGVAAKNEFADEHEGSRYDVWAGLGALLFTRATARAGAAFRSSYFDYAKGEALADLSAQRYGDVEPRIEATRGVGQAKLVRASAGAGAGQIFAGTRIALIQQNATTVQFFEVVDTKNVGATDLSVLVDIQAAKPGVGQAADAKALNGDRLSFEDVVFDATLSPTELLCGDGTEQEQEKDFQARVRIARRANRVGYEDAIVTAMKNAGAAEAKLFASDYFGNVNDFGLNRVYVADASFNTSAALLRDCRLAAFDCITCGMAPQILPVQSAALKLTINFTLWTLPEPTARAGLIRDAKLRVIDEIARGPFIWKLESLASAARGNADLVSDVVVTASVAEPNVANIFASTPLTRWTLSEADCSVLISQA